MPVSVFFLNDYCLFISLIFNIDCLDNDLDSIKKRICVIFLNRNQNKIHANKR